MSLFWQTFSVVALVACDVLAVAASYVFAYVVRSLLGGRGAITEAIPLSMLMDKAYLLVAYPFVFAYERLYTKRLSGWEEARRYVRGMLVATAVVTVLLFMIRFWIVSRVVVFLALVFGIVLVPLCRSLAKRALAATGMIGRPLVLLGNGPVADSFGRELARHRTMGYNVVTTLGRPARAEGLQQALAAVRPGMLLAVITDSFTPEEMRLIFRHAEEHFTDLLVVPSVSLLQSSAAEMEQVGGMLMMRYRYNLLRPLSTFAKRAFDLTASGVLAVLLVPAFVVCALLVLASSRGPVFFLQPRVGRLRRIFSCRKFRTMYVDADARLHTLLASSTEIRQEWELYARITNDPRVTPVGRFLRRFSLDELPQLWNVLKGEMALVGPRPYLPSELNKVGEYVDTIVRVRPGMTGLWQVSGRAALPFRERIILDEYYIKNWSLWMDISILLRTARAVVGGRGVY